MSSCVILENLGETLSRLRTAKKLTQITYSKVYVEKGYQFFMCSEIMFQYPRNCLFLKTMNLILAKSFPNFTYIFPQISSFQNWFFSEQNLLFYNTCETFYIVIKARFISRKIRFIWRTTQLELAQSIQMLNNLIQTALDLYPYYHQIFHFR